jgi:hypothetical protein
MSRRVWLYAKLRLAKAEGFRTKPDAFWRPPATTPSRWVRATDRQERGFDIIAYLGIALERCVVFENAYLST